MYKSWMKTDEDDFTLHDLWRELATVIADIEAEQMALDARRQRASYLRSTLERFMRQKLKDRQLAGDRTQHSEADLIEFVRRVIYP
jgi:hypothetical protein